MKLEHLTERGRESLKRQLRADLPAVRQLRLERVRIYTATQLSLAAEPELDTLTDLITALETGESTTSTAVPNPTPAAAPVTAPNGGLLADKRILITGVLTESSIAFEVAKLAQEQGANIVLSSFGRRRRLTEAVANRLPATPPVIELDVTNQTDLDQLPHNIQEHLGGLDGVVHSISRGTTPPARSHS